MHAGTTVYDGVCVCTYAQAASMNGLNRTSGAHIHWGLHARLIIPWWRRHRRCHRRSTTFSEQQRARNLNVVCVSPNAPPVVPGSLGDV